MAPKRPRPVIPADVSSDDAESSDAHESDDLDDTAPFVRLSNGQAYILANAKTSKTSDQRFSRRVDAPFSAASYLAALPVEAADATLQAYDGRFAFWREELHAGFSLCFVGRGSKRELLSRFSRRALARRGDVVMVNGYVPILGIGEVLDAVAGLVELPALQGQGDRNEQRARAICEVYSRDGQRPLYLVVNSIEGPALRSLKTRLILARLAAAKHIHLVASMDHIRAPLLFPLALAFGRPTEDEARTFNFVYHHTPTQASLTFEPLIAGMPAQLFDEAIFPRIAGGGSGRATAAQRVSGAVSVLESLQRQTREIFAYCALRQQETGEPTTLDRLQDRFTILTQLHDKVDALVRELYHHGIMERVDDALRILLSKAELERLLGTACLSEAVEAERERDA